jgi:hypothetical protein
MFPALENSCFTTYENVQKLNRPSTYVAASSKNVKSTFEMRFLKAAREIGDGIVIKFSCFLGLKYRTFLSLAIATSIGCFWGD